MNLWPCLFFMQIHIRFISGENIWAGLQDHMLRPGAFLLMSMFPIEIFRASKWELTQHLKGQGNSRTVCSYFERHYLLVQTNVLGRGNSGVCVCVLSHVQLLLTPRTVAHHAPLSMGFFFQDCKYICHLASRYSHWNVSGGPSFFFYLFLLVGG